MIGIGWVTAVSLDHQKAKAIWKTSRPKKKLSKPW